MHTRHGLLDEINKISFVVNDLTLYLDTHPTDSQALALFQSQQKKRKELLEQYEAAFEPLTINCMNDNPQNPNAHFKWTDGPVPWEGGHI